MKLRYFLPFICAPLLVSCSGPDSDLAKEGVHGSVKSITERQCEPTYRNDKWTAGEPRIPSYSILNYTAEGNFLEGFTLNARGDTLAKSTVKREDGDIVEEVFHVASLAPSGQKVYEPSTRIILERVSDELVNFEIWDGGQLAREGGRYFDSKGRLVRQVHVMGDREVVIYYVYEKDLLRENYQEEADGSRSATQLYDYDDYDENGNWTIRLVYLDDERIKPDVVVKRELVYY